MDNPVFKKATSDDIPLLSKVATEIVREHFDPIIGKAQNDYMIERFQSVSAVREQLSHGYSYYFVVKRGEIIGFLAFYPKENVLYLSKFYLYKAQRGKSYSKKMLDFVTEQAKTLGMEAIELNVNRDNPAVHAYEHLGFTKIREEKNPIGGSFFMDDFVFSLPVK